MSTVDPMPAEVRAALVMVGVKIINDGVTTLEEFRAKLVEKFGDQVISYAESTFLAAKAFHAKLRDKYGPR